MKAARILLSCVDDDMSTTVHGGLAMLLSTPHLVVIPRELVKGPSLCGGLVGFVVTYHAFQCQFFFRKVRILVNLSPLSCSLSDPYTDRLR